MKIYVAGIHLLPNGNHKSKTQVIINQLPDICNNAKKLMGKDVITIIVLQEYALTKTAIPNSEKKKCLKQLEEAAQKYNNVVLIPGSFSAYEKFSACVNTEKRKAKIVENYTKNLENPEFARDPLFIQDFLQTKHKFTTDTLDQSICLQNSAYILSSELNSKKIKHKKSFPFEEENKLDNKNNYFYYLGADSEVKQVSINNKKIDIGLVICREHCLTPSKNLKDNPPQIEVIVSASVTRKNNNLFGALNIHMDSNTGLSVLLNSKHSKINEIAEVKSFSYYPEVQHKEEISIQTFAMPIGPQIIPLATVEKSTSIMQELKSILAMSIFNNDLDVSKIPSTKDELPLSERSEFMQEGINELSKKLSTMTLPDCLVKK